MLRQLACSIGSLGRAASAVGSVMGRTRRAGCAALDARSIHRDYESRKIGVRYRGPKKRELKTRLTSGDGRASLCIDMHLHALRERAVVGT